MNNKILVSYIPCKHIKIENEVLILEPIEQIEQVIEEVNSTFHSKNGFCFPLSRNVKYKSCFDENNNYCEKEVSRSPRFTPEFFRFYSTHNITLLKQDFDKNDANDNSKNPLFFLLQVIGYACGYRVMPAELWFDGKIPTKPKNHATCNPNILDKVILKTYKTWLDLEEEKRRILINIFYFYNRSPSYFWTWEKFLSDYRVFEAAFKFHAKDCKDCKYCKDCKQKLNGKERYYKFLECIKVQCSKSILKKAIDTRNNLIHMNNITPMEDFIGFSTKPKENKSDNIDDYYVAGYFRRMLHAVLGRLISLKGGYFDNSWDSIGKVLFDVE